MKTIKIAVLICTMLTVLVRQSFCQTNLQITSLNITSEHAVQLHWASASHKIYGIQYANALITNSDGTTAWFNLYDNYPSHGTNTFIGDFGNYDLTSIALHPKYTPMRFYRVVDEGIDNDTNDNPTIIITSPTNGTSVSGQITVSIIAACTNLGIVTTKLYVDGQQMDESDNRSNYVINTCEWANGSHILYAVATARSALSGPSGSFPISTSHGVSSYVPVTFSNLISQIAFSQPFFEPSLGQTQEVTAAFGANCDWTLQIQDTDSNVVRTASGSGNSMVFDWDGTGNGGTNIPDGNYLYFISAETNGAGDSFVSEGSGGSGGGGPLSPSFSRSSFSSEESSELWAVPTDGSGAPVPLLIYPPGFNTDDFTIFSASASEVRAALSASVRTVSFLSGAAAAAYAGPSGQSSTAPTRPPTSPTKNAVGTYGVAYIDWSTPQTVSIPKNGIPPPVTGVCHLDSGGTSVIFDSIPEGPGFEANFIRTMKKGGWKLTYDKSNNSTPALHANDMRRSDQGYGGSELFASANIGLFLDHGNFGTDPDFSPGSSSSKQTYFRISTDGGDNGWLRMCQIGFGGDLKWLGLLACNSLETYTSMANAGAIPLKTTHLICGTSTISAVGEDFGAVWAKKMLGGVFKSPEKIANAWFDTGHDQYQSATNLTGTITFRVAGYPECMDDTIKNNVAPISPSAAPGNLTKVDQNVFP